MPVRWVVIYGSRAAQTDLDVAEEIVASLKNQGVRVSLKRVDELTVFDDLVGAWVSVGGPVANNVSARFVDSVNPTLVQTMHLGEMKWCTIRTVGTDVQTTNCGNCACGTVGKGRRGIFKLHDIIVIQGICRQGTINAGKAFIAGERDVIACNGLEGPEPT